MKLSYHFGDPSTAPSLLTEKAFSTEVSHHFADGMPAGPQLSSKRHPMKLKAWGPGHLVGASILVLGTVAIAKALVERGQADAARARLAAQPSHPFKTAGNARGEYGR